MKRYSKKKGLSILILFVVILALCIYTVTAGFGDGKKGSARNIKLGLDLEGGVSITYVANEEHPSVEDMNDTIYKLQKRLETYSTEANVYQQGENRITVEIPGVTNANEILNDLGSPGSLYFIAETDSSGNSNWSFNSTTGEYELTKTIEDLEADGSIVCTGSDVANAEGLSYQPAVMYRRNMLCPLSSPKKVRRSLPTQRKRHIAQAKALASTTMADLYPSRK